MIQTTATDSSILDRYTDDLTSIFSTFSDKRQAHERSRRLIGEIAREPACLTAAIARHLSSPDALNRPHFPVVSFDATSNPFFEVVFNCWIPLPDRSTDVSTKSIHHHGPMLLTTATAFGPGYDHWLFARPKPIDGEADLFSLELIQHGRHAIHEVAFVDAFVAHVPIYPESLTITVCLWSNSTPTTWRDRLKRIPILQRNAASLRQAAAHAGLAKQLDLKVDDYKDYYPTERGFVGVKDREEFPYTSNEDYLYSLFHIMQETGNQQLGTSIETLLNRGSVDNPMLVRVLLDRLRSDEPIEGRLSDGHYGVPTANFSRVAIERALAFQGSLA